MNSLMKLNTYSEGNSSSANQEIPRLLRNLNIHFYSMFIGPCIIVTTEE